MTAQEKYSEEIKALGFKKKWCGDRSGWWWEKSFNHPIFRKIFIMVDDDNLSMDIKPYLTGHTDHYCTVYGMKFTTERLNQLLQWVEKT